MIGALKKHVWMPWRIKSQDWVIQCHPCSSDCLMLKGWSCAFCVVSLKVAPLVLASELESWNGGHQEWCWSWKSATPEACCFRREAASVEVQSRCWSSALVGVAFLMCCLSVEHGQTVLARAGGGQDRWRGGVDVEAKLLEDLAEGFWTTTERLQCKGHWFAAATSYGLSSNLVTFVGHPQFGISTAHWGAHRMASVAKRRSKAS